MMKMTKHCCNAWVVSVEQNKFWRQSDDDEVIRQMAKDAGGWLAVFWTCQYASRYVRLCNTLRIVTRYEHIDRWQLLNSCKSKAMQHTVTTLCLTLMEWLQSDVLTHTHTTLCNLTTIKATCQICWLARRHVRHW